MSSDTTIPLQASVSWPSVCGGHCGRDGPVAELLLPSGLGPWIPALPTMVCLDPIPWVKFMPTRFTRSFGESTIITLRGGLRLGVVCWGQQLAAVGRLADLMEALYAEAQVL